MKWTTEKPVSAGWYWQRHIGDARGTVTRLEWNRGGRRSADANDELYTSFGEPLASINQSEWSDAAIEPPS